MRFKDFFSKEKTSEQQHVSFWRCYEATPKAKQVHTTK